MTRKRGSLLAAATAACVAAGIGIFMITPAGAATDPAAKAAQNVGSPKAAKKSGFSVASVNTYWTPERMDDAASADLSAATATSPSIKSLVAQAQPRAAAKSVQIQGVKPRGNLPFTVVNATSGKVYFVDEQGQDRYCSGSTINSASRHLVLTAGHCVHPGGAGHSFFDVNKWVFVPAYSKGQPYGTWSANQLWTKEAWKTYGKNGGRPYDVAFAVMQDNAGKRVVDVVGGQGLEWNRGYGLSIFLVGYPTEDPYNGSQLLGCSSKAYDQKNPDEDRNLTVRGDLYGKDVDSASGPDINYFPMMTCYITAGSSGGPWLEYYSTTDTSYVNAINSFYFPPRAGEGKEMIRWQSPYFTDDTVGSLYMQVQNM